MKNPKILPKTAIIAITEKCNSRCTFCKTWECENPVYLDERLIDSLPDSLREINITGGEPFLHKKIVSIVEKFFLKGCKVIINTNGLVRISNDSPLLKLKKVGIRFSLDGIGEVHDSLRGVPGNYKKVITQIDDLQSWGFKDLGIVSTFSDANWHQLEPLYELSQSLQVGFTCAVAANSEFFYHTTDNGFKNAGPFIATLRKIIHREISALKLKNLGKALFMSTLARFASSQIKVLSCSAGKSFFFMVPSGEIFACNMRELFMGNLNKSSFEDIWFSPVSERIKTFTAQCAKPCWTMCNAKQVLKENLASYCLKFFQQMGIPYEQSKLVRS
jgi:MoaA/NifB/PqqE/SkfB family radical SAM enzyme